MGPPYNPNDRAADKQESRDLDAEALRSGAKSPEQLLAENAHFAIVGRIKVKR